MMSAVAREIGRGAAAVSTRPWAAYSLLSVVLGATSALRRRASSSTRSPRACLGLSSTMPAVPAPSRARLSMGWTGLVAASVAGSSSSSASGADGPAATLACQLVCLDAKLSTTLGAAKSGQLCSAPERQAANSAAGQCG